MRIVVILITILVLMIIPIILGAWFIKPEGVSSSACISCHKLDGIGILTTAGLPISNEYEWQSQLHQALDNPDCLACHIIHGNELQLFQHELLKNSWINKCALCHIDSIPDDTLHSANVENCGVCHSNQTWSGAFIEHEQFFRFDNNHTSTCDNCHIVANDFSQYSCYGGCHEHTEAGIRSKHLEEGIFDYHDCAECHRSGNED